jgi:hypothetical protein
MRCSAWGVVVAAVLLAAPPVRAQQADPHDDGFYADPPTGRVYFALDFQGVPGCSEARLFEDALRLRMYSWDIFAHVSPWPLKIRIRPDRNGFAGSAELYNSSGKLHFRSVQRGEFWLHGERVPLPCYEVIVALALGVAIAVTPLPDPQPAPVCKPAHPAPEPAPAPAPPPCPDTRLSGRFPDSRFSVWPTEWPLPPLEKPKPDPPKLPDHAPFAIRVGAAVWPELIANGWGSVGFTVDAGVRYRWASLGIEAHGDPPLGSQTFPGGVTVSFARVSGALLLCGSWGWFTGCGVADVGSFIFPDHTAMPASTLYSAAGVRAGLEFPVVPARLFLRVGIDMRAPIRPPSYTFKSTSIFQAAGPSVGLGLGLAWELPL